MQVTDNHIAAFNEKLLLSNGLNISPMSQNPQGAPARSMRQVVSAIDNERDYSNFITSYHNKVPARVSEIKYERNPVSLEVYIFQHAVLTPSRCSAQLTSSLLQRLNSQQILLLLMLQGTALHNSHLVDLLNHSHLADLPHSSHLMALLLHSSLTTLLPHNPLVTLLPRQPIIRR